MSKKVLEVDEDFDFGFTAVSEDSIPSSNDKVEKMYAMIMPLLRNLIKGAEENDYIHWPNRREKIESFIKKLEEVKDS